LIPIVDGSFKNIPLTPPSKGDSFVTPKEKSNYVII
jgi:hypothetical protein